MRHPDYDESFDLVCAEMCPWPAPRGGHYACTRRRHHRGDHKALGIDRDVLAQWSDDRRHPVFQESHTNVCCVMLDPGDQDTYVCTLPRKHRGDHKAHTSDWRLVARWPRHRRRHGLRRVVWWLGVHLRGWEA